MSYGAGQDMEGTLWEEKNEVPARVQREGHAAAILLGRKDG